MGMLGYGVDNGARGENGEYSFFRQPVHAVIRSGEFIRAQQLEEEKYVRVRKLYYPIFLKNRSYLFNTFPKTSHPTKLLSVSHEIIYSSLCIIVYQLIRVVRRA